MLDNYWTEIHLPFTYSHGSRNLTQQPYNVYDDVDIDVSFQIEQRSFEEILSLI